MEEIAARYKRRWEKLREERETRDAAKKYLQGRLSEALFMVEAALAKAEAEAAVGAEKAAKAKEQGYRRGRKESVEFLRKVLMTLAPDFRRTATLKLTSTMWMSVYRLRWKAGTPKRWSSPHPPVRRMISKMRELHL